MVQRKNKQKESIGIIPSIYTSIKQKGKDQSVNKLTIFSEPITTYNEINLSEPKFRGTINYEQLKLSPNFEIKYQDLEFEDVIGSGAFGVVFIGKWRKVKELNQSNVKYI